jgi:hypothetical protein
MSDRRDCIAKMSRLSIDDATTVRLLSGRLSPEDAPPGFGGLARMVRAAAGPTTRAELARESIVVSAAVAAVRSAPPNRPIIHRRTPMLAKLLPAKLTAVAVSTVLGAATAAAAAGTLPNSAQSAASGALSHVGLSVPKPTNGSHPTTHGTVNPGALSTSSPVADLGTCTAFLSHSNAEAAGGASAHADSSPAFSTLVAGHGGLQPTRKYCQALVDSMKQAAARTERNVQTNTEKAGSQLHGAKLEGTNNGSVIGGNTGNGNSSGMVTFTADGNGARTTAGGQVAASAGQISGQPSSDPGPNATANYGQCTAFLAGQNASAGLAANPYSATTSAFSELVVKHGGTIHSATIYCQGLVAAR